MMDIEVGRKTRTLVAIKVLSVSAAGWVCKLRCSGGGDDGASRRGWLLIQRSDIGLIWQDGSWGWWYDWVVILITKAA
ncbi:serine protease [Sesbania bispinosa]|nr:serine protease [Sesbania bispinosa]